MAEFDWTSTMNRLAALREEFQVEEEGGEGGSSKGGSSGGGSSKGGSSKGGSKDGESKSEEILSATQIAALAEMLDCNIEDLINADERTVAEAMEYLGYKLANVKYGRPGMHPGKYPWDRNEAPVGHALPHAEPTQTSAPSDKTAKVPKESSSPMSQKPKMQPH